jgi:hypothetical protein
MTSEHMFCPKCGKPDQTPETFCRQCGHYLEDYNKPGKKPIPPEQHLKANAVLSLITAVTSLTLAILLYYFFLGKHDTPPIIYITAGFLTAITAWQIQTFWRTMLLRKHFKKPKNKAENAANDEREPPNLEAKPTNELLAEANFENFVPPSVTDRTTRRLGDKVARKSTQSEQ